MSFSFAVLSHLGIHTFMDSIKLIPYLFLTYLILEYIEHNAQSRIRKIICRVNPYGPLYGALLTPVSGCGLAATVSNLYITKLISYGTLISVYLATADEMLPMLIVANINGGMICAILLFQMIFAIGIGLIIDQFFKTTPTFKIHTLCHHDKCLCHHHGILKSAIFHTVRIMIFILLISFILNCIFELTGEQMIADLTKHNTFWGILLSACLGLIPNCAVPVTLTRLYVESVIPLSVMMAGLFSNAGVGLLVFYKSGADIKLLFKTVLLLLICGICGGLLADIVFN